ncbi:hypothetical protein IWZ00DRAFT_344811 [Phyllosticta capitalensis]|uniref:uncharacterized protein n=1 Tax=Phyllosticta capitalensis TaxID=121624 RepID=UPI003130ECAB
MSVYNSAKDIKPMSLEEFKVAFKWVTGRVYVENGNNNCGHLFLSCHKKDLRYWQYVVGNRDLALTVTEINIDDSRLPRDVGEINVLRRLAAPHLDTNCPLRVEDIDTFQAEMKRVDFWHAKNPEPEAIEQFVTRKHEWVKAQVDAHLDILEKKLDKELLLSALGQNLLPNLKRVVLTSLPKERCDIDRPEEAFIPPSRSPTTLEWHSHFHDGPIPLSIVCPRISWSWPNRAGTHGPLGEMEQVLPGRSTQCFHLAPICAPFRGLSIVLEAFQESPKRLPEFSIIPSSDDSTVFFHPGQTHGAAGFPMDLFLPPLANRFQPYIAALGSIFENLEVLRLVIDCSRIEEPVSCRQFFNLLRQAKKLKVLHLRLEAWNSWEEQFHLLDFISASSTLEEIELDGVEFTEKCFLQFLSRHRRLRRVTLFGCLFTDVTRMPWEELFHRAHRKGYLQAIDLYINKAMERNESGGFGNDFLELPEMNRQAGVARWRRWKADPLSQRFPIEYRD